MTLKKPLVPVNEQDRLQEPDEKTGSLLSTSDLAALLGVPIATIYAWRYKGYGPTGISVGRHVKFRKLDVDDWLRRQEDRAS